MFEKSSNIKFHLTKLSSGCRIVPCGRTDGQTEARQTDRQTERQTDRQRDERAAMMKLIVAFRNFAKAPDKQNFRYISTCQISPFPC